LIGKRVEFCPSLWGGKDWPSAAYSQNTSSSTFPQREFLRRVHRREAAAGSCQLWLGTKPEDIGLTPAPNADHFGELQAWDPATGKKVWQHDFKTSQLFGSVTATAGDLILVGGTNDRLFRIFHAKTESCCGKQKTNSGIMAMRCSYEVDGTQYIAVQSAGASTRNASRMRWPARLRVLRTTCRKAA